VERSFDYVSNRISRYQTVMTAAVSNRQTVDGLAVEVQAPKYEAEEKAYLEMTVPMSSALTTAAGPDAAKFEPPDKARCLQPSST